VRYGNKFAKIGGSRCSPEYRTKSPRCVFSTAVTRFSERVAISTSARLQARPRLRGWNASLPRLCLTNIAGSCFQKIRLEDEKPFAERSWPSSGCLPICHHGCTFWSALVLQGQFAGRIWDVASYVAYEGLWVPASRPPGWWEFGMPRPQALPPLPSPPTFLEWFSGWLERCFADLRA